MANHRPAALVRDVVTTMNRSGWTCRHNSIRSPDILKEGVRLAHDSINAHLPSARRSHAR